MRALLQKVTSASVEVEGKVTSKIGSGVLALVGVTKDDKSKDVEYLARKISDIRLFGEDGGFDLSVAEVDGDVLIVSQFTLYGSVRKGRRPSFDRAAPAGHARVIRGWEAAIDR